MNTSVLFSSKTDLWATPQDLFDRLDREFHFTLDVCALPENAKCMAYYTPQDNGLAQPWTGVCWCNPPYGRSTVKHWVQRAWLSSADGGCTVVMLLPARTDTCWFHEYIYQKSRVEIRFLKGRLKFGGSTSGAPFPSMIVIFRSEENSTPPNAPLTLEELRGMDGEPVYLDFCKGYGEWVLVQKDEKDVSLMHKNGIPASFGWAVECGGKFYRRKPEEETV